MTARAAKEIIQELEDDLNGDNGRDWPKSEALFLFRAFRVMREIAIENRSPNKEWDEHYSGEIDSDFEERMRDR